MNLKNTATTIKSFLACGLMVAASTFAAETLFGNRVDNVNASGNVGELWIFSSGDLYSGVTLLSLDVAGDGSVRFKESKQGQVSDSLMARSLEFFSSAYAERRRVPSTYAGNLGYVVPMYDYENKAEGFFSIKGVDDSKIREMHLQVPDAFEDQDSLFYGVSGFAFDSSAKLLWYARSAAGLGLYDYSGNSPKQDGFALNLESKSLDSVKVYYSFDSKKNPSVFGVARHPATGELWMATSKGLWIRSSDGKVRKGSTKLDTANVTGLWIGGSPLQIIAETSTVVKGDAKGALWRMKKDDKDFAKVAFLDSAGKPVQKDVYGDRSYTVSGAAFIGANAFVAVAGPNAKITGYFRLDSAGIRPWDVDDDGVNQWLYGYESGATDRDAAITSICSFPLSKTVDGLALGTFGNGVSVSADSGKSWTYIMNRAKLSDNLGSVRMVPSVITAGDQSLVSYKVGKDSKITIDVFSYDMKKVRTIVKSAPRKSNPSRSTDPKVDFWDGYDSAGRPCTMGVYYIRVKDNHGHVGWGKTMTLGGHK